MSVSIDAEACAIYLGQRAEVLEEMARELAGPAGEPLRGIAAELRAAAAAIRNGAFAGYLEIAGDESQRPGRIESALKTLEEAVASGGTVRLTPSVSPRVVGTLTLPSGGGRPPRSYHPSGYESTLADVLIRLAEMCRNGEG